MVLTSILKSWHYSQVDAPSRDMLPSHRFRSIFLRDICTSDLFKILEFQSWDETISPPASLLSQRILNPVKSCEPSQELHGIGWPSLDPKSYHAIRAQILKSQHFYLALRSTACQMTRQTSMMALKDLIFCFPIGSAQRQMVRYAYLSRYSPVNHGKFVSTLPSELVRGQL